MVQPSYPSHGDEVLEIASEPRATPVELEEGHVPKVGLFDLAFRNP
jgi:hypothetical protein